MPTSSVSQELLGRFYRGPDTWQISHISNHVLSFVILLGIVRAKAAEATEEGHSSVRDRKRCGALAQACVTAYLRQ
jgi:hypothetical protein